MSAKLIDYFEEKARRLSLRNVTRSELFTRALTPNQQMELQQLQELVALSARAASMIMQQQMQQGIEP